MTDMKLIKTKLCPCELKRVKTHCEMFPCHKQLHCRKCKFFPSVFHRLDAVSHNQRISESSTHWADVYDIEYPNSCDECYQKVKTSGNYKIIESYDTSK